MAEGKGLFGAMVAGVGFAIAYEMIRAISNGLSTYILPGGETIETVVDRRLDL